MLSSHLTTTSEGSFLSKHTSFGDLMMMNNARMDNPPATNDTIHHRPIPTTDEFLKKLPSNFVPRPYSVVFGRATPGCRSTHYSGNKRLRRIVAEYADAYGNASTKAEKVWIVSTIIDKTREGCDGDEGQFVVQKSNGFWYEAESAKIRDKVGGILREILHTKYKSSSKAKRALAKQRQKNPRAKTTKTMKIKQESTSKIISDDDSSASFRSSPNAEQEEKGEKTTITLESNIMSLKSFSLEDQGYPDQLHEDDKEEVQLLPLQKNVNPNASGAVHHPCLPSTCLTNALLLTNVCNDNVESSIGSPHQAIADAIEVLMQLENYEPVALNDLEEDDLSAIFD